MTSMVKEEILWLKKAIGGVKVKTITIIINDAPYGGERPWNALRLASTLTSSSVGLKVNLFLLGDAVSIAKKGQNPPEGYYNLEKMLTDLVRKGVEVHACGTCARSRGLKLEDLVEGVQIGTMVGLATWIEKSDTVLTF